MQFSQEQIRELAPDEKSVVAARKISSLNHWDSPGLSEVALWGISGGGRYQVRIDLEQFGYNCNCPSRKYPCKHVLSLLMLLSSTPDAFDISTTPDWVQTWIEKRRAREKKQEAKKVVPKKPVDSKAQAKRVQDRESRVREGLEQLIVWMDDLIRNGIAGIESQPFSFWDNQARRLVDAQAKGLASRVYKFAEIPNSTKDWPKRLLNELGRTRLLIHAYLNQEQLSPDLRHDVRQLIGWTVSQSELEENGTKIEDDWFIFGQRIEEEDRFLTQRSWAIGKKTQQEALLLQFAPNRQPFPETIHAGTSMTGTLTFYPSSVPQRARISATADKETVPVQEITFQETIESFYESYASRLSCNPWLSTCSCLLSEVSLSQHLGEWYLRDKTGMGLPLDSREIYRLLAVTGGKPFQVLGEWNGRYVSPMSFVFNDQLRLCS